MLRVVEVPRRLGPHLLGMLVGGFLLFCGWQFWRTVSPVMGERYRWVVTGVFVAIGAWKLLGNLRLVLGRPPALRASSEGVWFGGGPMIRWQDIESVYYPEMTLAGRAQLQPCVAFSFHRRRTLFRLPPRLWFTTPAIGHVAVSSSGTNLTPAAVIAQLDALRGTARDGAGELPRAQLRG